MFTTKSIESQTANAAYHDDGIMTDRSRAEQAISASLLSIAMSLCNIQKIMKEDQGVHDEK